MNVQNPARRRRPQGIEWVVPIEFTLADVNLLMALLHASRPPARATVPAPREEMMGTKQVAEFLHVAESTIRSWTATDGPKADPFPKPSKYRGRCEWERSAVEAWENRRKRRRKKL